MYFKPSQRSVLAIGGGMSPDVRSWKARFVTGGKKALGGVLPRLSLMFMCVVLVRSGRE